MVDSKDISIALQNASTSASRIVAAEVAGGAPYSFGRFEEVRLGIYLDTIGKIEEYRQAQVTSAVAETFTVQNGPYPPSVPVEAQAPPVQVPGPPVPQVPMAPPVPQVAVQAPQAGVQGLSCKQCNGTDFYDDRAENQTLRASGQFKLKHDFKCKSCGKKIWPPDYDKYKHLPGKGY